MAVAFTRQLGYESGVQLNPLQDNTDGFAGSPDDQLFAIPMRATRGRIDGAFLVNRSNATRKLGKGESIRLNRLNEAQGQVNHALNNGAYQALVYRLHTDAANLQHIVVKEAANSFEFSLEDDIPANGYLMAIKHLECFNDGIKVSIHADELTDDAGAKIDNPVVTLRVFDADDVKLFEFTGSLDQTAKNDFGETYYLPDVIENQTDLLVVETGDTPAVKVASDAYGSNASGYEKAVESDVQIYFDEGGTGYTQADYLAAKTDLGRHKENYAYISVGGSQSVALISEMINLAYDTNRQFRFDIEGSLTPEAAVAFIEQFSIQDKAQHLVHAFWKPVTNRDPLGVSPKYHMGAATLNIAYACARNAVKDAKGFAKKNAPIAGKAHPLNFNGMVQTYFPTDQELSMLAKAKINPVMFEEYTSGTSCVFVDSLTMAKTELSNRKLIAATDMSTAIDDAVTRYSKECLQLPMTVAVQRMTDFLKQLFEGAESAKWLKPSKHMNGNAFDYSVLPNEQRPADLMDVRYMLSYDGTTRQITVTQTYAKP